MRTPYPSTLSLVGIIIGRVSIDFYSMVAFELVLTYSTSRTCSLERFGLTEPLRTLVEAVAIDFSDSGTTCAYLGYMK
jgi:hypothetical protein